MYLSEHTLTWVLVCNAFGVLGACVGFVAFFLAYRSIRRRHAKAMQELHDLSDDIAHDLRTPLARMHAQAELAAMGEVSAQELAAGVAEETTSMLELINTMLDLSQTGARIERSPRTDVDLAAIVRQMTDFYASVAEDKRVAFILDLPEGEIVRSAHKAKLQQLVGNLLGRHGERDALEGAGNGPCAPGGVRYGHRHLRGRPGESLQALLAFRREPFAARQRAGTRGGEGDRHVLRRHRHLHLASGRGHDVCGEALS